MEKVRHQGRSRKKKVDRPDEDECEDDVYDVEVGVPPPDDGRDEEPDPEDGDDAAF